MMMMELTVPVISAATAAILAILTVLMSLNVTRVRASVNILLGDGGNDRLIRARWAHNQLFENAPTFLIVLMAHEMLGGIWVVWMAALFVVGRLLHVYGAIALGPKSLGRGIGAVVSSLATLAAAIGVLITILV